MPFGMMTSCVICTLTNVPFLLFRTPYIGDGMVTHEITRTMRERSMSGEQVTQVKHNGQVPLQK